jgi:hypothetical protein
MVNYITAFTAFIQQLNLPGIRVFSSDMRYYLNAPYEAVREGLLVVDPGIEDFYRQVEYMHAEWLYDIDANLQDISLLDQETDIIAGKMEIFSYTDVTTKESHKLIYSGTTYLIFDKVSSEDLVCLRIADNKLLDELFWIDLLKGDPPVSLNTKLEKYFLEGFGKYFMYGWQKAAFLNDAKCEAFISHYKEQLFPIKIR